MTVASKLLLRTHYNRAERFSYFIGGSSGGRQAICEALRFPEDYDGIIAFKAVNNRLGIQMYRLWNHIHLTTSDGKWLFSQEEANILTDCAVEFLGKQGDDFVSEAWKGEDTVGAFLEFVKAKYAGFSEEQQKALRAVYDGPIDPKTGEQIFCGMPIGSEIYRGGMHDGQIPGKEDYLISWVFGKEFDLYKFDFHKDFEKMKDMLDENLNCIETQFDSFSKRGGKVLAYCGMSDPLVPYADAIEYYNCVVRLNGGIEKTKEFFRLFLIPGMAHCAQGKGYNDCQGSKDGLSLLDVLRRWREEDRAPEMIVGINTAENKTNLKREISYYKADWLAGRDYPWNSGKHNGRSK